jgi:hypothetical protein
VRCRSMQRDGSEPAAFAKPHDAKLRVANARGVLKHRLEHRRQLTGRA